MVNELGLEIETEHHQVYLLRWLKGHSRSRLHAEWASLILSELLAWTTSQGGALRAKERELRKRELGETKRKQSQARIPCRLFAQCKTRGKFALHLSNTLVVQRDSCQRKGEGHRGWRV